MDTSQTGNVADAFEFDHINIMDIDPTFHPVDAGFYKLQINKLAPKVITPAKGKNAGKAVLVLSGSFKIVEDATFAGRMLWKTFWTSNPVDLKDLRRLADATGVVQEAGETISDWGTKFESLNPPAELKVFVGQEKEYNNPESTVNVLKFNQAQPAA